MWRGEDAGTCYDWAELANPQTGSGQWLPGAGGGEMEVTAPRGGGVLLEMTRSKREEVTAQHCARTKCFKTVNCMLREFYRS